MATAAHFISVTIARMQFVELAIRNPLGRGALFNNKNHLDLYNFHFHLNRLPISCAISIASGTPTSSC